MTIPSITKHSDLDGNWFKKVCLEGIYKLVNTSRLPHKPSYGAYAMVQIENGSVLIGLGASATRSEEERNKYTDKKVRVTGTLNPDVPWWGDGVMTPTIMGPALTDIKKIELI
jgi:hypothetical protein